VPKVESLPPAPATARCASGYMLGTPSIRRYSPPYGGSDNATGADNQQERPARFNASPESSETIRRTSASIG
jgi:hypothetical protein